MVDFINFADEYYETSITTEAVSSDGNSIENLLKASHVFPEVYYQSHGSTSSGQGFMAEYFVKPPSEIILTFPCLIDVESILLQLRHRSHVIASFDISAASVKPITKLSESRQVEESIKTSKIKVSGTHKSNRITNSDCINKSATHVNVNRVAAHCNRTSYSFGTKERSSIRGNTKRPSTETEFCDTAFQRQSNCSSTDFNPRLHHFGASKPPEAHEVFDKQCRGSFLSFDVQSLHFPVSFEPDLSIASLRKQHDDLFTLVGRYYNKSLQDESVVFRCPKYSNGKGLDYQKSGLPTRLFSHLGSLQSVSHVVIKINRMHNGSVVALKHLEVWGKPSYCNSRLVKDHIFSLVKHRHESVKVKQPALTCASNTNAVSADDNRSVPMQSKFNDSLETKSVSIARTGTKSSLEIPEEFIDPITCDIMVLPMLLPSGYTVDSSTLARYMNEEEIRGRNASDPFTGIPLTEKSHAIPNTSLKLRIDDYVLKNGVCNNQLKIANTIGRPLSKTHSTLQKLQSTKRKAGSEISLISKKPRDDLVLSTQQTCDMNERYPGRNSASNCQRPLFENGLKLSHENSLAESLNRALNTTLRKLPFKSKEKLNESSTCLEVSCSACQLNTKETHYFKLPCSHVLCRNCIKKDSDGLQIKTCFICKKDFTSSNVERVHSEAFF